MRNFLLFVFLSFISFNTFGQFSDACPGGPEPLNFPTVGHTENEVCNLLAAFNDEGNYTATSLVAPINTGFYSFQVTQTDYYRISFIASGAPAATGTLSVGFGTVACPPAETDAGNIVTGFDISSSCVELTAGVPYYLAFALQDANAGQFTVSITRGGIDECVSAAPAVEDPVGLPNQNILSNLCSTGANANGQGTIWSTYTVGPETPNEHISVNISTTAITFPTGAPSVISVWLNGCPGTGQDITGNVTCLSPGDILYIESGNTTPQTGTYNLNIDQFYAGEPNDDCADLTGAIQTLTCSTDITGAGNVDACPDPLHNLPPFCGANDADAVGVWYRFNVHASVPQFSFTGSNFRVWTGANCGALAPLGCDGSAAVQNILGNPTVTYWVLVFGNGNFTASSDVDVPVNDLCADAVTLTNGINGYNACATGNWTFCTLDAADHTVHYEYENTTGTYQDLSITITGQAGVDYPAVTQVSVAVIEDCGGTQFQGFTPICNNLGTAFAVDCIPPGESFILVVGSQDGQEGGFTINFTATPNPVANDMCDGAIDFGTIPTDCIEENNPGNNTGACQDDYNNGGCDFNQNGFHGVWYQFTTDNRADLADIETNLTNAIFSLYTGNCNALTYVAGSCSGTGSITDVNINPNTTYYLLISSANESANFNIGITIKNIPDNDLCNDAELLTNGIEGTTSCATPQLSFCGLNGTTSHDVFYTYTNNTGSNIDLEVTVAPSTATSGTATTNVSVAILSSCPNTQFPNAAPECNTLGTEFLVACIEDGETVIFAIGSPDGAQGDFSFDFNVVSDSPANDECIDATVLTYDACEWETINGTNEEACPEDFTAGTCDFDQQAVVWYSFVATADATSVEFRNLAGAGTPFLGLFNNTANCNAPTAVAGAACVTADAGPFNITGGNTYLIAFGGDAEAAFSFEMRVNEDKANDDPCAPGFAPTVVTAGNTIDDNTCATPDFTVCGVTPTEGKTLFYRYTMTQNADLQINVAGSGLNPAGGPIFIGAYEGSVACNDESNYINEDCTGELIIPCLSTGDVIIIMVATGENAGEFGQFTLTITQNTPARPANDECFNATDIQYENDDLCQWVDATAGESNVNACTEASDFGTGCDYDLEEVVWFTFTAPGNTDFGSDLSIQFLNYSGTGQLFTTVFNNSANCNNLTPISACLLDLGPHGAIATVDPNTTYLIGVGSTGDAGGTFNIQINITSGPPNDDACDDLSAYDLTGGGTLNNQYNLCSSPGGNFPECPADDQTNAVFYTFTISAPNYGIRLVVAPNNSNGTPVDFPMVGGVSAPDGTFCPPGAYTPPAICSDDGIFEFSCLEEGDYQFKFSTSEPNSGDFNITATMLQQDLSCSQTASADACDEAGSNVITGYNLCEPFGVTGCNTFACPEDFDYGGCDFSSVPVIWYSFTTPDGEGITLDITGFRVEGTDGFMSIFSTECPVPGNALSDCIQSNGPDETGIALEGNTTYHLAIGNNNGTGGWYEFLFTINAPPINDSPCPTWPNPPYDLSGSGSHSGTTCCAVGFNDDSNQDHRNVPDCSGITQDNAVWYTYEIPDGSEGIEITVDGGTIGGNPVVEVYFGPADMGCNAGLADFLQAYDCGGLPVTFRLGPCTEDGELVWIKVGSSDADCGTFSISINPAFPDCEMPGRTCEDATHAFDLVTDPNYENIYEQCADYCLDLACPDPTAPPGCDFSQAPTVWIQIGTDDVPPTALITSIVSHGLWEPLWSVYYSATDDCSDLTPLNNFDNTTSCFDGNTTTAIQSDIQTYWIAVTANPEGPPIDDPGFTLCAYTRITVLTCIGPDGGCEENDPSLQWEATWRENGGDLNGPFCPGEEVTFHLSFFYDAGDSQVDWFHGIIPDFGLGWDLLNFDWEASMPVGNGTAPTFHEEGSACEAVVHRTFPHLCTYRDEFGILRMRHIECDDDFTDCIETGLLANQGVLPNGYFWLSNGGSPTCVNGSCRPRDRWGIGSKTAQVEWDYTIRVREFDSEQHCEENKDLQMSFLAFSDDGAGCWEDSAPCRLDKKQYSPPYEVSCAVPPGVLADEPEICDEGQLNIVVQTDDGSPLDIEIWFEPNPNVVGMNNHYFTGGFGTIDDALDIVTDYCAPEEVWYYARVIDPEVICEGKVDTIIVTVYPRPEIEQNYIPGECYPSFELYNLEDYITCEGYPGNLTISWVGSNGTSGNTPFIQIDGSFDPGIYTYTVTLTDELGCTNTSQVSFEVYPPVHFDIEDLTLCYDDGVAMVCPDFDEPGTPQYTYLWSFECLPATSSDACFQIDPIQILSDCGEDNPLQWDLDLYVFDSHYCEHDTSITVTINPRPGFVLDPPNPAFCEGADEVEVCLLLDDGVTIEYAEYLLAIGGPVTVYDPNYCLTLSDEGLYSVAVYDANGCTYSVEFYCGENIIEEFDILGDPNICYGGSTTLTVGGTYDAYSWSTGETSQSITVDPTVNTTYSVNVIDGNGCFTNNSITVEVLSTSLPALPDTVTFCIGFSAEISAGAGYDVYNWHFGSPAGPMVGTTDTIEVTAEGWYFIEVFKDGCPALDSVYAQADDELSPFVFGDFELCWDQQTTLISATGGAFIDYIWTQTDVLPQQVWQGPTLSSMNLGEGSYELWVSDGNCAGDITFDVTRAAPVVVDITPAVDTVFVCFNGVTNLSATPGFAIYAWNTGQFGQNLTNVGDGVYTVTVTDADGCKGTTRIVVFEYPPVSPNLGPTRNICEGDLVTLTPGPNFTTYTWYQDGILVPAWNNQASITVGDGGIYNVQVTNAIGCTASSTVTVIKTDQLTPFITGNQAICQGTVLTLSADQDYFKYTWKNAAGVTIGTGKTVNVTIAGVYTLEVETSTGCAGSAQVTVVVNITPTADVDSDVKTVCGAGTTNNGNTILDFTQYINSTDPGVWSANNPSSGVVFNANWSVVNFSNVAPGTYTFTYTTTNAIAPCQNTSDVLTVNVILCNCDPWSINPIDDVCNEGSQFIIANLNDYLETQASVPMIGTWSITSGPALTQVTGSTFNTVNALPGVYTLTFTLTNQGNYCDPSANVTIEVMRAPQIGTVADQPNVCFGTGADYNLETLISGEDMGGSWTEISAVPSTGNAFNAATGTFNSEGQIVGIYRFMYTLVADDPCIDKSITVEITVNPIPNADAGPDGFACAGGTVNIGGTATSTGTNFSYEWRDQTNAVISTLRTLQVTTSGNYKLTVTNNTTGCIHKDSTLVVIYPSYSGVVTGKDLLLDGETDVLRLTLIGLTPADVGNYIWYKDGVLIPGANGDTLFVNEAGEYCVDIVPAGNDASACVVNVCKLIQTELTKEVFIPNIFSPNNDGKNEIFTVEGGKNVDQITNVSIYDRWGELVFLSGSFTLDRKYEAGWNGIFKGQQAVQGVYVYVVDVLYKDGTRETVSGDITLIR